jgi:hypothetical protein
MASTGLFLLGSGASDEDVDLDPGVQFTDTLWRSVKEDYVKDSYFVKGFETLHLLNVRLYEREISRLEYQIAVERRFRDGVVVDEGHVGLKKKLRKLLRDYSKKSFY